MPRPLACAALALICGVAAAPAWAQSLGEVARKESERRATAKKAVKSFSNADLNPSEIFNPSSTAPAAPAECFTSISEGKCVPPEKVVANSSPESPASVANPGATVAQKEAEWRANAEELRVALEKAQSELKRFNAAGDAAGVQNQQMAIANNERKWWRLEKQAEDLRVPRAWLDPRPTLTTQRPQ